MGLLDSAIALDRSRASRQKGSLQEQLDAFEAKVRAEAQEKVDEAMRLKDAAERRALDEAGLRAAAERQAEAERVARERAEAKSLEEQRARVEAEGRVSVLRVEQEEKKTVVADQPSPPPPPTAYTMTVHRNKDGLISHVEVTPK